VSSTMAVVGWQAIVDAVKKNNASHGGVSGVLPGRLAST